MHSPSVTTASASSAQPLWKRLCSFPALLAMVLAGTVEVFANRSIADPDIWWHLRNAEWLVQHHAMVRSDFYSYTVTGSRWINHEWLTELPYYFAWKLMGIQGIYLVLLIAVEIILLGVFGLACYTSKNAKAAFIASWFAAFLATISFGPRTLLFGWIYLVLELYILWEFREGRDKTWILPPLFLIWVNSHGSWLIGLVFLGVFAGSGLLQGEWGRIEAKRWTPQQLRKMILICSLCVAALFINPYTYHLVFYPFDLAFRQKLNISHVTEWQTLDFHSLRGKIVFGMLATTILLALTRKRTWRLDEVLFLLIAFYSGITYSRFMFLSAIVVTPLLAKELAFLPNYRREIDKPLLNGAIILAILIGCSWTFPSAKYLMEDSVKLYPVKATAYLQQFHPQGRVFADYLWGGYMIWNVRQIPVFVDSRVDIYEYKGVFGDYLDAMGLVKPLEVLDKYHIQYVLFTKDKPLSYLLAHAPGWKIDYQDDNAMLFERTGPTP